jgi:oligoribonuclease NrnB/cAMP/cGMP phosphodiesterase (DHH superfamily)
MKCFYHNDADGKCAAHIVSQYTQDFDEQNYIEIQYGMDFPFDIIGHNEDVYIVDYSIEPHEMEKLLNITENVVWIDHHISTIAKYKDFVYDVDGIREDGTAGCVLTHKYLFPNKIVPWYVLYIGDRDVWKWEFGDDTLNYFAGSELYDLHPLSNDWGELYYVEEIIRKGKTVEKYKAQHYALYLKAFAFEAQFEGHEANIINVGLVDSKVFDSVECLKDIQIMFVVESWGLRVSLRSAETSGIDVSKIATQYGGGGHKHASGFEWKFEDHAEPFPWVVK